MGLKFQVQRIGFEGGKAWGVHHVRPAVKAVELHMAGGMASPAESCADLSNLDMERRVQSI